MNLLNLVGNILKFGHIRAFFPLTSQRFFEECEGGIRSTPCAGRHVCPDVVTGGVAVGDSAVCTQLETKLGLDTA